MSKRCTRDIEEQAPLIDAKGQSETATLPAMPMTLRQIAGYLGVGDAVVRHLCRTGGIKAFKVGGQWRAYPEHITDYIMKQLQKS